MPTVLCSGRRKLSFGFLLHRCLFSQVKRGQHSCAKDIWRDMTQSCPSEQALAGDQGILFNATDGKQPTTQQRQGWGLRMTRHPHVAPHKSMLVDDLRLSSDDDDAPRATRESTSWEGHSVSHTNGRRVRHSSSNSSQSHSSVESVSGSLHSRSSSPAAWPTDAQSPCSSSKETDRSTAAQWQLDKWLKKSQNKVAPSDPTCSISGDPPSPRTLKAPSPARCWDSNQEYSPSQSPIPSPQLSFRPSSPLLSPDYGFCPSPLPSTCPSPSNSRRSSTLSPAPSEIPSPCGSSRVQHSPKPSHRGAQLSPTSSPLQSYHYPEVQSHLYAAKFRSRIDPLSNSDAKTKLTNSTKAKPAEPRDQKQNKSKAILTRSDSRRPQNRSHPGNKKPAKHPSQYERIQGDRPGKAPSPLRHSSQHLLPTGRENNIGQGPSAKAVNHPRPCPNPQPWAKPSAVNVSRTSHKNPQDKKRDVVRREVPQTEGRKDRRREDRHREEARKEDRRLAEEQLLRHRWIETSAEEEEEEAVVIEKQRRRPREKQQIRECQTIHFRERQPQNNQPQRRTQKKTKRRDSSSSLSPPPQGQSCSSSALTNSDSEYQTQVAKVPADSTSLQKLRRRTQNISSKSRGKTSESQGEGQQSETRHRLYTLVPFGRSEQAAAPSQRGLGNLVVHIDLCLLKRVPDTAVNSTVKATNSSSSSSKTKNKQTEAMKHLYMADAFSKDSKRKRKLENGVSHKESKRNTPQAKDAASGTKASLHVAECSISTETVHNGFLEEYLDDKQPLSPLSPLSDNPETTEHTSKSKNGEVYHKNKDKSKDSALKPKKEVDYVKVSRRPLSDSWGPAGHRAAVANTETPHHAEYYLHEAKRMKHRADAMVDKLGKAVNYVDAALSFMECGKAMEDGPLEAKSPYTMYAETVELIRYAMRLKSHSGPGARQEDKQLAVLCFRCLALLYWQMFRLKKDHALKYSKVLLDYFKTSPKVPLMPSCWNDTGKDTGGPSPPQLPDATKHIRRGSHGDSTSPSLISIPQRIHQMAANHLNITNSVLYSYEYWEVADNLAKESKEFFNYLNTLSGPLTLHSSIVHAVQYTRQALQWIRISAKLN
ncbi:AF4/FMR2 family member 3 [Syngnathus scovelli]|uniref:AF4/FMR2 family member 3 n=1 Tax=Syngnathus scovelli TaxID=161590 RepID=UPI00210F7808|nr:AF4/FMR2 family member 2 [Syngnathus scovelli]